MTHITVCQAVRCPLEVPLEVDPLNDEALARHSG